MTETGKIVSIDKQGYAVVRIQRSTQCGKCTMCGMSEQDRHVDLSVANTLDAKIDDEVKVELNGVGSVKISLIVYLIPLALALIFIAAAYLLSAPDWLLAVLFTVGLAGGYVVVRIIDKKFAEKLGVIPKMIEIISGGKKDE